MRQDAGVEHRHHQQRTAGRDVPRERHVERGEIRLELAREIRIVGRRRREAPLVGHRVLDVRVRSEPRCDRPHLADAAPAVELQDLGIVRHRAVRREPNTGPPRKRLEMRLADAPVRRGEDLRMPRRALAPFDDQPVGRDVQGCALRLRE